jgi:hypothetical protein
VPQEFEAARLINETRAGIVVESTDIDGIERNLLDSYRRFPGG